MDEFNASWVELVGGSATALHSHTTATSLTISWQLALSGDTSVTVAADTDNWNPTGLTTSSTVRVTVTGAHRNITGLIGGADGRILLIHNIGSFNLILNDESVSSTEANRFALSTNMVIVPDSSILLQYDSTSLRWRVIGGSSEYNVEIIIDGGGSVISTGIKGDIELPSSGTIEEWRILPDQLGSIQIDVWKDTYANFPPTVADTIVTPTLVGTTKSEATGLAIVVNSEDVLRFNVDSATTVTRVTLSLKIRKA